jgi:acid phosphatase family membrane protein YuiD
VDAYPVVRAALTRAAGGVPGSHQELIAALALIPAMREDLDATERAAIDAARRCGASWAEIATALGLRSRQAAEQRRLRLDGSIAGRDAGAVR